MMNLTNRLVCNIITFFSYSLDGEANVLQALMAPEYCELLEQNKAFALNGIGYCENTFTISSE